MNCACHGKMERQDCPAKPSGIYDYSGPEPSYVRLNKCIVLTRSNIRRPLGVIRRVVSLFVFFPLLLSSPWAVPQVDSAGAGRGVKSAADPRSLQKPSDLNKNNKIVFF